MTFTRGRQQDTRPLFSVGALVFDNGVLDRLTVDTGATALFTIRPDGTGAVVVTANAVEPNWQPLPR